MRLYPDLRMPKFGRFILQVRRVESASLYFFGKVGFIKIVINTNLKLGIPMENVNKIAGPFVEAWAYETFAEVLEDKTIATN
jgi:hypothetical protein